MEIEIDELTKLMKTTKAYCPEDNTRDLVTAFKKTRELLHGGYPYDQIFSHLYHCKKRYNHYIQPSNLRLKGPLLYLRDMIYSFIKSLGNMDVIFLLSLAHCIDSELLFALGNITLEEEDSQNDDGDTPMIEDLS